MKQLKFAPSLCILLVAIGCEPSENMNASIITLDASEISAYSAELGGNVASDGEFPVLYRGVCWHLEPDPTLSDNSFVDQGSTGKYMFEINTLSAGKTYYARAFYINASDTIYGNQIEFKTQDYKIFNPSLQYGTLTDIDGNVYKTIKIGDQTWMAENLRTTRYQNGDPVEHVKDLNKWGHFQIQTGAYVYYDNDESNKDIHGALYNWYAAADSRNVAPEGWHVPTVEDWQKLSNYLDPFNSGYYGHQLLETTTAHWYQAIQMTPVSTNNTGFTAIPSGMVAPGQFKDKGLHSAYYWTSTGTEDGSSPVYIYDKISIDYTQPNARGFSIRCVMN